MRSSTHHHKPCEHICCSVTLVKARSCDWHNHPSSVTREKGFSCCIAKTLASWRHGRSGVSNLYLYHGCTGSHQRKYDAHFIRLSISSTCAYLKQYTIIIFCLPPSDITAQFCHISSGPIWMHRLRMWWKNARYFVPWEHFFGIYFLASVEVLAKLCSSDGGKIKTRPQIARIKFSTQKSALPPSGSSLFVLATTGATGSAVENWAVRNLWHIHFPAFLSQIHSASDVNSFKIFASEHFAFLCLLFITQSMCDGCMKEYKVQLNAFHERSKCPVDQ